MKPVFVRDLTAHVNQEITTFFLVAAKETRLKKTGEPFLSLLLSDATGEVEAKMWDNLDTAPAFERDDFVKVKGLVQAFRNKPQIVIHKMRRMEESEIELPDFLACAPRDPEEMFAELRGIVAGVADTHLRALLEAVLDDEPIAARLKRAPAGKTLHHAYLGGLLEHVLSLCGLCQMAVRHYPALNLDLLITAAVLHDLGKTRELEFVRSISYTTEGQLLGHIVLGLQMVSEKIAAIPDFPASHRALVEHLIISHHGEYEFGSPKLPMFPEALVFHYLDNIDSKMNSMNAHLGGDGTIEGEWTSRNPSLGRPLLKRDKYFTPAPPAAAAEAAPDAEAPGPAPGAPPDPDSTPGGSDGA